MNHSIAALMGARWVLNVSELLYEGYGNIKRDERKQIPLKENKY